MRKPLLAALFLGLASSLHAQVPADSTRRGVRRFAIESATVYSTGSPRNNALLIDAGRSAGLIGDETGSFDVWMWPERVVRDLRLSFQIRGTDRLIDAKAISKIVTARPEGQTIVYSHPLFTVREHVFAALYQAGAIVLLDVESARPLDIGVRMETDLGDSVAWQESAHRFQLVRGDAPEYHTFVGSPFASAATRQGAVLHFVLQFDSATAASDFIPIVIAGGANASDSGAALYTRLTENAQRYREEKSAHFRRLRSDYVSIETPDSRLNQAFEWAKVNLDQQLVCADIGCGLIGAIGPAGSTGYEFTGNAALASLGMDASGQFDVARQGLSFLAKNHSWFHADRTPFWILACYEYWLASGDDAFLRDMWPGLVRALNVSAASAAIADAQEGGVWTAALDGLQRMARAQKDNTTLARAAELGARAQHALNTGVSADSVTVRAATPIALGLIDTGAADDVMKEIGSAALTADWGVRKDASAVSLPVTGIAALAHYRQHRAWAGNDLVRDMARATFDFARGRTPDMLSGAFYQLADGALPERFLASALYVLPIVRGLAGWETDAPKRAAALEPHMPAEWAGMTITDLRVGRDRLDAVISRENGVYTLNLHRLTAGPPLAIRVAPALPLGARVERIVVNDRDVPPQVEETAHDIHGVAEIVLEHDAQIEFHYDGGMELVTPLDHVEIGESSGDVKVLDFRRDGRDYVVSIEGLAGRTCIVQLRTDLRVRAVTGADSFDQTDDRVTIRATIAPGNGFGKKTIRIRV